MQTDQGPAATPRDTGGAVVSVFLIAVACLVLWDAKGYTDGDSAVFPRTFAGVLIAASVAYIVLWLSGRGEAGPAPDIGSTPRRLLLVAIMLGGAVAMPWIGFIAVALPVFGALTLVAMFDPWTPRRVVLYPVIGLAIVMGFYYLFSQVLQVPLPTFPDF